jgi:hypothetical protein
LALLSLGIYGKLQVPGFIATAPSTPGEGEVDQFLWLAVAKLDVGPQICAICLRASANKPSRL